MKLCLIGSTRFKAEYHDANQFLTSQGHVVYSVAFVSSDGASTEVTEEAKIILDLVHLRKIAESDAVVLITDVHGYVGFSTKREMVWAQMLDKPVYLPPNVPNAFLDHDRIMGRLQRNGRSL